MITENGSIYDTGNFGVEELGNALDKIEGQSGKLETLLHDLNTIYLPKMNEDVGAFVDELDKGRNDVMMQDFSYKHKLSFQDSFLFLAGYCARANYQVERI